jgi:hypothetical protein
MEQLSPKAPTRGMEAFASRDFTRYQLARVMAILGAEAQSVAVAWQVYSITHRALDLGFTGLALFLPGLLFLLPAGHVADRFDRRQIILVCYGLQVVATTALLLFTRAPARGAWRLSHLWRAVFHGNGARILRAGQLGADSPPGSGGALCQRGHVGRSHLAVRQHHRTGAGRTAVHAAADALGCPDTQLQGAGIVYVFTLASLGWFLVLVASLHARPGRMEHRAASLKVVLAGFQYVRRSPMLLGASSLDLFVVLLGGRRR